MISNDAQLANTIKKLQLLEQRIAESRRESDSAEQDESVQSLESLARQLTEEIVRYRSAQAFKKAV